MNRPWSLLLLIAGCAHASPPPKAPKAPRVVPASNPVAMAAESSAAPAPVLDRAASPPVGAPSSEPPPRPGPRSGPLQSGWFNPMPGGILAGYRADTGLDIAGNRQPVFAIASGSLDYAEAGHTLWTGPGDTANTVRLELDEPVSFRGRIITHVWYAHLSLLRFHQPEGAASRIHVEGGELLGVSGIANGSPHLHLGLLLDGEVEQYAGTYLLEDAVREVLGGLAPTAKLPGELVPPLRPPPPAEEDWLVTAVAGRMHQGGDLVVRSAP